jgi:hypothetical protein
MAALRDKEGITNQAIAQRRARLTKQVPAPTDIATYAVAHRATVNIARFLPEDVVSRVAEYEGRLHQKEASAPVPQARKAAQATTKKTEPREVKFENFKVPPGTLSEKQLANAEKMAREVYPLLYAVENSMREFVNAHLTGAFGKGWWDREKIVSRPMRDVVKRNKAARGQDRWVLTGNVHPIYLIELGHLSDIITSEEGWPVFRKLLPRQSWVTELVKAMEQPRNVVAHMNPLQRQNINGLVTRAQEWFDQIKDHPPPKS